MNIVLVLAAGVGLLVAIGALLAVPVMLLWNGVVIGMFAPGLVRPIGYWSAWGLLVLCGLLFKSSVSTKSE